MGEMARPGVGALVALILMEVQIVSMRIFTRWLLRFGIVDVNLARGIKSHFLAHSNKYIDRFGAVCRPDLDREEGRRAFNCLKSGRASTILPSAITVK
jgi:hypothetical protein